MPPHLVVAAMVALVFPVAVGDARAGSGRTIIDVSYDYAQVRLRPTYDGSIRGSRSFQIILSGDKKISTRQSNRAGKHHAEWTTETQAGSDGWHFAGQNRITKETHWPQSTTLTTLTISSAGTCTVSIVDTLKPGFTEYKTPMLSRNEFGYYTKTVYSNRDCRIRNEE